MSLTIHTDIQQGTEEWHAARRGIVTASVVAKLVTASAPDPLTVGCSTCHEPALNPCISTARKIPTPIKTPHDTRAEVARSRPPVYAPADNDTSRAITATLAAERITGWTEDSRMTDDMWRGVECEPIARDYYANQSPAPVTEVGFMRYDGDGWTLGYSPDGLVGDDGLIEIKAPRAKGHLMAVLSGEVPSHYMAQCQAGLLVTGRKWIDYVPFVGGLPLWTKRIEPDPSWHRAIVAACRKFEAEVTEMTDAYLTATAGLPATERVTNDLGLVF